MSPPDSGETSLHALFKDELLEQLEPLCIALAGIAAGEPDAHKALLYVGSAVRGAARIVGLRSLSRVAHALEIAAERQATPLEPLQALADFLESARAVPVEGLAEWDEARVSKAEELAKAVERRQSRPNPLQESVVVTPTRPRATPEPELPMLDLFRAEVEAHTFTLSEGLIALDADPTQSERLDALMRAAHSVKGAARILGLDAAVMLSHAVEDCLISTIREGIELDAVAIDQLLRATDCLAQLAHAPDPRVYLADHTAELEAVNDEIRAIGKEAFIAGPMPLVSLTRGPVPDVAGRAVDQSPGVSAAGGPPEDPAHTVTDRVVRVTASHLDRLLGLAGEGVMDARQLQPFSRSLHRIYIQQSGLLDLLSELRLHLGAEAHPGPVAVLLDRARARADEVRSLIAARHAESDDIARRTDELSRRLYRETIDSRMRPFRDGVQWFPRLVRDLSRRLGKPAELRIVGGHIRVDRDILEKIEAPLNHLLRNALDHGVEPTADRRSSGKADRATLTIEARPLAGMLSVTVSDDGRGIDVSRVRRKLVDRGLATADEATLMSEPLVLDHLFAPGFSTTDEVTELSGRGVGLDVVKTTAQDVGGSVRVSTTRGHGTSFQMLLPLTLSVTRAAVITVAGDPYAVPLVRVHRLLRVHRDAVRRLEGREYILSEGEQIGLVDAATLLELAPAPAALPEPAASPVESPISVVVLRTFLGTFGLVVDAINGEHDLVVRALDPRLGKVADVIAASILADGAPVLILDVEEVVRSVARRLQGARPAPILDPLGPHASPGRVLIVDDSITVREVQRQILLSAGYDVVVAVDGVEGWQTVRDGGFDLVITDVDMPRMDGLELTRSIRRDPSLRDTPVLIVSYRDHDADRARGLEVGATRYLTKSEFHEDALLGIVAELVKMGGGLK